MLAPGREGLIVAADSRSLRANGVICDTAYKIVEVNVRNPTGMGGLLGNAVDRHCTAGRVVTATGALRVAIHAATADAATARLAAVNASW